MRERRRERSLLSVTNVYAEKQYLVQRLIYIDKGKHGLTRDGTRNYLGRMGEDYDAQDDW